jgi:hypothetical protein
MQDAEAAYQLVQNVMAHFKGKPAQVQGAALADLLAMWLAGHLDREDPEGERTERIREVMLEAHLVAVRALIPINYKSQVEPQLKARRH